MWICCITPWTLLKDQFEIRLLVETSQIAKNLRHYLNVAQSQASKSMKALPILVVNTIKYDNLSHNTTVIIQNIIIHLKAILILYERFYRRL